MRLSWQHPRLGTFVWLAIFILLTACTMHAAVWPRVWYEAEEDLRLPIGFTFAWVGAFGMWMAWYVERRHAGECERICRESGWRYLGEPTVDIIWSFPHFWLFSQGAWNDWQALSEGTFHDLDMAVFDYRFGFEKPSLPQEALEHLLGIPFLGAIVFGLMRWIVPRWRHRKIVEPKAEYSQTLVVFRRAAPAGAAFQLTAKHAIWARALLTPQTIIDLPPLTVPGNWQHARFANQYAISGSEAHILEAIFMPACMDYFAARPGWNVEAKDGEVLVYRMGVSVKPRDYPAFLLEAADIVQQLNS